MAYVSKSAKELKRNWPITSGLIAGTTKQEGRQLNLVPQGILGVRSIVSRKDRVGL